MRTITEDKAIGTLAIIGMAAIVSAAFLATITFMPRTWSGNILAIGLYALEGLGALIVLYFTGLLVRSFLPKRRKGSHIANLTPKIAQNITGTTLGINR